VVSREIGSELLVVPIRGGVGDLDAVFSFNGVGSDVWALIENERSMEQIVSWVVEHYEVSPPQVEKDLAEFLTELVDAGLATSLPQPFVVRESGQVNHASR
jgi:hypothetical protein